MKLFFPIFKRLSNSLYSNAKGVVFVSRYTKDLFLKYFKGKLHSFAVIHNGICPSRILDHDSLLTKLACKKNKLNLITISRLDPRKNHEIVIEAIDSLPINIKNRLSYRIAGVGQSMEFLVSLVNAKNLKDIITFEGRISERRKWDLLDSSDVYVMPSKELKGTVEGLGISFLEAAARGLPLIGGNHGGIPEIVINGVNGYLVKSDNSEHVANAIRSFVNDRELVNYMSINSRRIVKNFTRHNMAAKTVKFICPKDRISSNQD
jgi:phosphatidylinositol alpha-1,6-mannosyltransferase